MYFKLINWHDVCILLINCLSLGSKVWVKMCFTLECYIDKIELKNNDIKLLAQIFKKGLPKIIYQYQILLIDGDHRLLVQER